MNNKILFFLPAFLLFLSARTVSKINRKEVVQRHNITISFMTQSLALKLKKALTVKMVALQKVFST
jgi:hypothetical protein